MDANEAREVLRREESEKHGSISTAEPHRTTDAERGGIKVRLMVGPVSIDTEAESEQIIVLVKRMVQEFQSAGIIPKV